MREIEMRGSTTVNDMEVLDPSEGKFLLLSRFFINTRSEKDELVLLYQVQQEVLPHEFYAHMHEALFPCTAGDISDLLVTAFDWGMAQDLGFESGVWAYETADLRYVHQHST